MQSAGVGLLVSAVQNALEKWVKALYDRDGRELTADTIRELWVL
jgi:hypothetical protein